MKSDERTSEATLTLRPIRTPRGMTARLPTTVIPVFRRPGSCLFGRSSYGPVADDRALADHDLLVEDRPVDHGAGPDDRVEHDDRVAHDGPDVDPHAGRQDRVDDGPVDDAAMADQALVDLRGRADLGRSPFLGAGVDDPVLVVQVELRVVVEQAMLASQNDWIVPTSCQ